MSLGDCLHSVLSFHLCTAALEIYSADDDSYTTTQSEICIVVHTWFIIYWRCEFDAYFLLELSNKTQPRKKKWWQHPVLNNVAHELDSGNAISTPLYGELVFSIQQLNWSMHVQPSLYVQVVLVLTQALIGGHMWLMLMLLCCWKYVLKLCYYEYISSQ